MTPTAALQTLAVVASGVAMAYREPLGPGAYVVQAMEESSGSDPAWTSDTAMEKMAEARVQSWRESFGLQSDDDFGFAFDCYENAVAFGGHHVANAWVAVRAAIMDAGELIPAAAQVIQPGSSLDTAPKAVAKKPSMLKGAKGKPKLRLRTGPDQPEQLELRISVLSRAFLQAGVLHPGGHLSPERIIDWQRACRDLAQTKVTAAEPATILNALKTFAELQKFQKDRERQLPPDELDLHSFLLNGTKSAQRALNSLKWFCKHGRLAWPVQKLLLPPEAPAERQRRQQAIAVEPPMLRALEEKIQSLHEAGDERWLALLSSWLIAFGVLRFKHLQRSRPIKITQGSFHAHCPKGKQTSKRSGFDFAVPGNLTTGWPWGQHWFQTWSKLPEEARAQSGLCFDAQGNPFSLAVATSFTQQCFQHLVENPKDLTSYSWRRVGPTAGQFLGFDTMQLNSLGDWQDKSSIPREASMPLHYSAARYDVSLRTKHMLHIALGTLTAFESWEVIPEEEYRKAMSDARHGVDAVLKQEIRTLWAKPTNREELQARFQLSEVLKKQASERREASRQTPVVSKVPSQVNGKVLSQYLKNGATLCGDFQNNACRLERKECPGLHLCAVLRASGRVCGGGHAAVDCRDKKWVRPTDMEAIAAAPPPPARPSRSARVQGTPEVPGDKRPASAMRPRSPSQPPSKKQRAVKREESEAVSATVASSREGDDPPEEASPESLEIPDLVEPPSNRYDARYDRMATVGGKTTQGPTCVYENRKGGRLWISGIPTRSTAHSFPTGVTLQICCMSERPESRGGVTLGGALVKTFAIADPVHRNSDWAEIWPLVKATLFAGESVLTHCMAGRHRAGGATTLMRAGLAQESFDDAARYIKSRRPILDIPGLMKDKSLRNWLYEMHANLQLGNPFPQPVGYVATNRSKVHLELAQQGVTLCAHKQSGGKASRLVNPFSCTTEQEALGWSKEFCSLCLARAPASWQPR